MVDIKGKLFANKRSDCLDNRGFTLIELLIVIAIIAILAAVIFVALNPLVRFQDSRDSVRWQSVSEIMTAINIFQVDSGGYYPYGSLYDTLDASLNNGDAYMISRASTTNNCDLNCSVVSNSNDCVNLRELVDDGYLGTMPVSPNGTGDWSATNTGYYLIKNSNGSVTVGACEAENSTAISVTR